MIGIALREKHIRRRALGVALSATDAEVEVMEEEKAMRDQAAADSIGMVKAQPTYAPPNQLHRGVLHPCTALSAFDFRRAYAEPYHMPFCSDGSSATFSASELSRVPMHCTALPAHHFELNNRWVGSFAKTIALVNAHRESPLVAAEVMKRCAELLGVSGKKAVSRESTMGNKNEKGGGWVPGARVSTPDAAAAAAAADTPSKDDGQPVAEKPGVFSHWKKKTKHQLAAMALAKSEKQRNLDFMHQVASKKAEKGHIAGAGAERPSLQSGSSNPLSIAPDLCDMVPARSKDLCGHCCPPGPQINISASGCFV